MTIEKTKAVDRLPRIYLVIWKIAEELFCDLIGSLLMGPSFFLSLLELLWGKSNSEAWNARLHPEESLFPIHPKESSYPSDRFRLHCAKHWSQLDSLCEELAPEKSGTAPVLHPGLAEFVKKLNAIPVDHHNDRVFPHPESDPDADAIAKVLNSHLASIKQSLEGFLAKCASQVQEWFPGFPGFAPPVKPSEVAALLDRLEHDILPNIVPDGSLLGVCPQFTSILNASALYRLHLLATGNHKNAAERAKQSERTAIVERLTAKAFEVTFIQRKYRDWSPEGMSHGDSQ